MDIRTHFSILLRVCKIWTGIEEQRNNLVLATDLIFTDKKPSVETAIDTYPVIVTQKSGKKVPIVQAYAYTKYLGSLTVKFDNKGNVIEASGNPILLNSTVQKGNKLWY